jgi:hypothetical protein
MQNRFLVPLFAMCLTVAMDSNVAAQSMFGGRGPISGPTGTQRPFSPGGSQGAFSPVTGGGTTAAAPSGGFVGRGNPRGRFIGARQSTSQGGEASAVRRGGQQRPGGVRAIGSENAQGSAENLRAAGSSQRAIRARERIAFDYTVPRPTAIKAALVAQFVVLAKRYPAFADIDAHTTANGQVTLRGKVPSDDDRRLIELIVRMQPGVRSVQNELTIVGTPHSQTGKSESP